jgi:hypothetical protein
MADPSLGQVTATVFEKVAGRSPEDNIFGAFALLNWMKDGKSFRGHDGGREVQEVLEYAENTTFKSMSELETISTDRIDVFDAAQYAWKQIGGAISFSELEKARAQGRQAKIDLVSSKIENGLNSAFAILNRMLAAGDGTGNSSKDVPGLLYFVPTDPTTGTVGAINRATFPFWRSKQTSGAKASAAYDNLRGAMRTIWTSTSRGLSAEHPDLFISGATIYNAYEGTLTANERFTSKGTGEGGFTTLLFKGAKVTFDTDISPTDSMYALNSKNFHLNYPRGAWMKKFDPVDPANQFVETIKVLCILNTSTNNSRRLGVITGIT